MPEEYGAAVRRTVRILAPAAALWVVLAALSATTGTRAVAAAGIAALGAGGYLVADRVFARLAVGSWTATRGDLRD